MKVLYAYVLLALALILTASPAVSQAQQSESFVAKVAVSDEAVTFHIEGRYTGFNMTVSGPDDFYLQRSFAGDEVPSLRLKTDRSYLASGSYAIEVTASPYISKKTMAKLEEVRAAGDKAQMRKILKEAIGPQDMVYSINVGIAEGKFLDPYLEEPVEEGKDMGALEAPAPQRDARAAPGYVAAPDVTGTGLRTAFQIVDNPDAPQFINASSDLSSPWFEAYFKNMTPDGAATVFQGYLRPIETDTPGMLFLGYFRPVADDGNGQGDWQRGYFQYAGNNFKMVDLSVPNPAMPFDYLIDDNPSARRDQVILDDLIVDGSACIGFDCVNGESFGFDTIRIKENNLRIRAQDTSSSASFPRNDWQITFNDSANGGAESSPSTTSTGPARPSPSRPARPAIPSTSMTAGGSAWAPPPPW